MRFNDRPSGSQEAMFFHPVPEGIPFYIQESGRLDLIVSGSLQGLLDQFLFHIGQGHPCLGQFKPNTPLLCGSGGFPDGY